MAQFGCKDFHPVWNQCCKWLLNLHILANWNKVKDLRKYIIFYYKEQLQWIVKLLTIGESINMNKHIKPHRTEDPAHRLSSEA